MRCDRAPGGPAVGPYAPVRGRGTVEAELTASARSGATTLVGLTASDAWSQVCGRLARPFACGGETGPVDAELERSRRELTAARVAGDGWAVGDVEAEWRTRLREALRADPAAVAELCLLLAEGDPAVVQGPVQTAHNIVSGGVRYGPVVQGQNFGPLTFYASGSRPDPEPGVAAEPPADGETGG